jgi:hypothetical protein
MYNIPLELINLIRPYFALPFVHVYISGQFSSFAREMLPKDRSSALLRYAVRSVSRLTCICYASAPKGENHNLTVGLTPDAFKSIALDGEAEIDAQYWADLVGFPNPFPHRVVVTVKEAPDV